MPNANLEYTRKARAKGHCYEIDMRPTRELYYFIIYYGKYVYYIIIL